ncbi:MAG: DUF2125 domain-containing protein [Pseudomonadota bacterium]
MGRIAKWFAGIVLAAGLGWLGWWFAAAAGQEAALEGWFAARAAEGWQAEGEVSVEGFPLDFARRIEGPALADPAAGWAWQAAFLEAASPAWDPTNIAFRLPDAQDFAVPQTRVKVASERFEGLLSVVPGVSLPLRALGLNIAALEMEGREGWRAGAERVAIDIARRTDGAPENTYSLDLTAEAVRLPERLLGRLGMTGEGALRFDGQVVTDRPLDLDVVETGVVGARTLVIREGRLALGSAVLAARGRLDADADGLAEGSLDIEAEDWQRLLEGLVDAGALDPRMGEAVSRALGFAALLGGRDKLSVTLGFSGGAVRIGPIAIGNAPRLLPKRSPTG